MINNLPRELIECARQHANRFMKPIYCMESIHAKSRTNDVPTYLLSIGAITESTDSSFKRWVLGTDDPEHTFDIRKYMSNDLSPQMSKRFLSIPNHHPDVLANHLNGLSNDESKRIHDYIHMGLRQTPQFASGSVLINYTLWDSAMSHKTPPQHIQHPNGEVFDIHGMDAVLDKTKLHKPLTTYTGINFNPKEMMSPRGIISVPSYLSTSTRRFSAAKYALGSEHDGAHHILAIHNPIGSTGIYVGNRNHLTSFSDDEYIMPRNIGLSIRGFTDHKDADKTFRIWNTFRQDTNNDQ